MARKHLQPPDCRRRSLSQSAPGVVALPSFLPFYAVQLLLLVVCSCTAAAALTANTGAPLVNAGTMMMGRRLPRREATQHVLSYPPPSRPATDSAPDPIPNLCLIDVDLHSSFIAFWGKDAAVPLLAAQSRAAQLVAQASSTLNSAANLNASLVQLAVRTMLPYGSGGEASFMVDHGEHALPPRVLSHLRRPAGVTLLVVDMERCGGVDEGARGQPRSPPTVRPRQACTTCTAPVSAGAQGIAQNGPPGPQAMSEAAAASPAHGQPGGGRLGRCVRHARRWHLCPRHIVSVRQGGVEDAVLLPGCNTSPMFFLLTFPAQALANGSTRW